MAREHAAELSDGESSGIAADSLSEHVEENVESILELQRLELAAMANPHRRVLALSRVLGRPGYLIAILFFIGIWITLNTFARALDLKPFDPPPFFWLEGLLTIIALMTTTVVLIVQSQQTKAEERGAHLDLQVNLLTEQKVTKLIHLLEELRRDLPMVKDRHDPEAAGLQERADTTQLASALNQAGVTSEAKNSRSESDRDTGR